MYRGYPYKILLIFLKIRNVKNVQDIKRKGKLSCYAEIPEIVEYYYFQVAPFSWISRVTVTLESTFPQT